MCIVGERGDRLSQAHHSPFGTSILLHIYGSLIEIYKIIKRLCWNQGRARKRPKYEPLTTCVSCALFLAVFLLKLARN